MPKFLRSCGGSCEEYFHRRKEGITAALDSGFRQATSQILTFYPADLELLPEDLPPLIRKMEEGYDLVAAWRQGKRGGKQFVTLVYNLACRALFNVKVHDLNCAKVFKREILDRFALQEDWHRYIVVLASAAGYRIGEEKIPLYPRQHGKSKFGIERILKGFWDLVVVWFVLSFSEKPMRLFGNVGLTFTLLGTLLAAYLSWLHFLGQKIGDRPLFMLAILLIITGIQFFGLGLIGELINRGAGDRGSRPHRELRRD